MLNILFLILKPLSLLNNSSSWLRKSPALRPWWAEGLMRPPWTTVNLGFFLGLDTSPTDELNY